MKKLKITRFSDGGHSWFSVKRKLLIELGIDKEISHCSYQKGESVFLEEDCDYSIFLKAYFKKFLRLDSIPEKCWEYFDIKTSYKDRSPVRNYASYTIEKLSAKDIRAGMKVNLHGKNYTIVDGMLLIGEDGRRYKFLKSHIDSMVMVSTSLEKELLE